MLFSYVTLVKMEDKPSVQEWLVIVYILSTAVEKTREARTPLLQRNQNEMCIHIQRGANITYKLKIVKKVCADC